MADEKIGGYLLVAGYALILLAAIKAFGLRRVVVLFLALLVVGFGIALRTLGGITSTRR